VASVRVFLLLIILYSLLSFLDTYFTSICLSSRGCIELNPILSSKPRVLLIKIPVTLLINTTYILLYVYWRQYRRIVVRTLLVLTVIYTITAVNSTIQIVLGAHLHC